VKKKLYRHRLTVTQDFYFEGIENGYVHSTNCFHHYTETQTKYWQNTQFVLCLYVGSHFVFVL